MPDGQVPASADAQVRAFGADDHHATVGIVSRQGFRRAVGRVIVHHDDVKREVALLSQGTLHCVADGAHAVAHGNDDARRNWPILRFARRGIVQLVGCKPSPDGFQVFRHGAFHLQLHLAVSRVDIVKLLLPRCAQVRFRFRVERLAQVDQPVRLLADEQPQRVPRRIFVAHALTRRQKVREGGSGEKQERTEVEVVAQRPFLVIDDGMRPVGIVAVGVEHERRVGPFDAVLRHLEHTVNGAVANLQAMVREPHHSIFCRELRRNLPQELGTFHGQVAAERHARVCGQCFRRFSGIVTGEKKLVDECAFQHLSHGFALLLIGQLTWPYKI